MKLLLIGPQGSGKSTQGRFLSEYLKIPFISTGDIFRSIAQENTDEGRRIKEILSAGKLVDDETAINLTKKRLEKDDCKNGYILDGVPRTLPQAENLNIDFDKVIHLKIDRNKVLDRLLKRGREDDTPELINQRLDLYFQQTQLLLEYFQKKGSLIEINGEGDIQTVQDEIKKSI